MFKSASKINKLLTILGLGLGLMVLIACVSQSPEPTNNAEASGRQYFKRCFTHDQILRLRPQNGEI